MAGSPGRRLRTQSVRPATIRSPASTPASSSIRSESWGTPSPVESGLWTSHRPRRPLSTVLSHGSPAAGSGERSGSCRNHNLRVVARRGPEVIREIDFELHGLRMGKRDDLRDLSENAACFCPVRTFTSRPSRSRGVHRRHAGQHLGIPGGFDYEQCTPGKTALPGSTSRWAIAPSEEARITVQPRSTSGEGLGLGV